MRGLLPSVVVLVGFYFTPVASAQEEKPSKTFADILSRVSMRDSGSGAILRVRAKEDSPQPEADLEISIFEGPNRGEVVIELRVPSLVESVFERYKLKADAAIRAEIGKQKSMREQVIEQRKKQQEVNAEQIRKLTDGKLKYGMTEAEVIKVLGEPEKTITLMQTGRFILWYPTFYADFEANRLTEISLRPKKQ